MYNRYIPQADGSYRRSRVEVPSPPPPKARPAPKKDPPCEPPKPQHPPLCPPPKEPPCHKTTSAGSFLQNLLPQNFDTGDLIVVLLLLLLAGDCEEDRSNALLTLVLYLFM